MAVLNDVVEGSLRQDEKNCDDCQFEPTIRSLNRHCQFDHRLFENHCVANHSL